VKFTLHGQELVTCVNMRILKKLTYDLRVKQILKVYFTRTRVGDMCKYVKLIFDVKSHPI
jgi:hypothetical protein